MARRARSSRGQKRKAKQQVAKKEEPISDTLQPGVGPEPKIKGPGEARGKEPVASALKVWFNDNRYTILILTGIFALAFLLRFYLYYELAFDIWPPRVVGNDPSYHKRVIDFIQADFTHLRIDGLLNYPLSGGNPRPPVFDWSIAIGGILLAPFFGFNVENSTWFVFEIAPTLWGAMTIFPLYMLGKEAFGRKAGIMAAFFLAITAAHIERSTLGFADHDSFVVFFLVLALYFLSKSFNSLKDQQYIEDWRKPESVILGFRSLFLENREAMSYAFLTGISIATISLAWQGFGYVLAILLVYYLVQIFMNRLRGEDSLGVFVVILIAMASVVVISLPYYYMFSISTWSQGFYIFLAAVVLGAFIVPTRDMPWLIVIPTLALFLVASYFILQWGFPETATMLFTGGGYFVKNKLYSTIAEAQAPDISRLVFTYGPGTFFLGLIGIVMAFIQIPKQMKKDYMVIVIWTGVAIYMALSATRFTFNATPAFALLAGWVIVKFVKFFKAEGLSIVYSIVALLLFLGLIAGTSEGWDNFFYDNYIWLTVLPISLISILIVGYMKYRKNRDNFKFRTILTALTVAFVIIFPNLFFAADASIPYERKTEFDPDMEYFGAFGSSLHSEYWMDSYIWLSEQDLLDENNEFLEPEDRPGFMSWWDYGFDQLLMGQHPTAADNFQNGYQFTGSMISCQNESESIALMVARLIEGDWVSNKGSFSDDVWDVLVKYLGDDPNSTYSAYEIKRIYFRPGTYTERVENNPDRYGKFIDITPPNAKYAAARSTFTRLGEEGVVSLYHDIRDATGRSLRYFAVDYRLFPFSSSNTGIFYAPIKLADRNVDDYLEYKAYAQQNLKGSNEDPVWEDYPDNPISMDKVEEEAERLGYKFRILQYDMFYTEDFYNSMFYRTYVGYAPSDVGAIDDGKSIPGILGEVSNMPAMQGWNMTHWQVVYRTMYYSEMEEGNASFPDDYVPLSSKEAIKRYYAGGGDLKSGLGQGVFYLKYYDGAKISGRVMTERGIGVPNVRVTVLDDYGIPHGNVMTGPNGEYSIIAPPGQVNMIVTDGALNNEYDKMYQFQVDQSTGQPTTLLNSTVLQISDALAMWEVDDGEMDLDMYIAGKIMGGRVYWDLDGDSTYSDVGDEAITEGSLSMVLRDSDGVVYGPVELDENGYSFSDLVTGYYDVEYTYGDHTEVILSNFKVDPKSDAQKDIRFDNIVVHGNLTYGTFDPVIGGTVRLIDEEGVIRETVADKNGNYSFDRALPGQYWLEADVDAFMNEDISFILEKGDNLSIDIPVYPYSKLGIRAYLPPPSEYLSGKGGPAVMSLVTLYYGFDTTRKYVASLDEEGYVEIVLPAGEYDLQITSIDRAKIYSYIGKVNLDHGEEEIMDITLQHGYAVTGRLTKLVDTPMEGTYVNFQRVEDSATVFAVANLDGAYTAYLPRGDYKVLVDNKTTGNVSYFHMQDLKDPGTGNRVELDIWAEKTIEVTGQIFWDKDRNGILTTSEEAIEINDQGGSAAVEFALSGVPISFTYENGTIAVLTEDEGLYQANLPVATYTMGVDIYGFEKQIILFDVEGTVEEQNFGINNTDAKLISRDTEVLFNVTYNMIGKKELDIKSVSDLQFSIMATEIYMNEKSYEFKTDGMGQVRAMLPPGEYFLTVDLEYEEGGMIHRLWSEKELMINPSNDVHLEEVMLNYTIEVESTMYLIDEGSFRYPGEVTVSAYALFGSPEPIVTAETDYNGRFTMDLPLGDYILHAEHLRFGQHYMHWDMISVGETFAGGNYEMRTTQAVTGSLYPDFEGISQSYLYIIDGDKWLGVNPSEDGQFSFQMFEGEYEVDLFAVMAEELMGESTHVQYELHSELLVEGPVEGLDMELNKWVEIRGSIYYDENSDGNIGDEEKIPFATMSLMDRESILEEPINITADEFGQYRMLVPFVTLDVTVVTEGYKDEPSVLSRALDIALYNQVEWDIEVIPRDLMVTGTLYFDTNEDGEMGQFDGRMSGMKLTFTDKRGGVEIIIFSEEDGSFELELIPGGYSVVGFKYEGGLPVYGYLAELQIETGEDLLDEEWMVVGAKRVSGTIFFTDTDGDLHLPEAGETILWRAVGQELETEFQDGAYRIDLPYYEYTVTSSLVNDEYDMDVTYSMYKIVDLSDENVARDFALELEKEMDYSFSIDLVKVNEHEQEMASRETKVLMYFIENTGNEPIVVNVDTGEKPDGWIMEYPFGTEIELEIGQRVERQLNVTSPAEPRFYNSIKVEGSAVEGTIGSFEISIKTPPSQKVEISLDVAPVVGVNFGETMVINVSVNNLGSGEDVVNLMLDPMPVEYPEWEILWNGDQPFPEWGENASMIPYGGRTYSLIIKAPTENVSRIGDSITLKILGKNRKGDLVETQVTVRIAEPNLVILDTYLKLTNRKLTDPLMQGEIEANITVMAQGRDVSDVNVSLWVGHDLVGESTIFRIAQGETSYTRIRFNLSQYNISENKFHTFQVVVDPYDTIKESNEGDNAGVWDDVLVGEIKEETKVNWRIVIFVVLVILVTIGILAYRQKTQPI